MTRPSFSRHTTRLRLEHLEDRSVPSTFTVNTFLDEATPDDGKLSLREAVMKANTTLGADVITLQAGVYNLSLAGRLENAAATGDLDVTEAGQPLTIQGAGIGETEIDANGLDRVLHVFPGTTLILRGLTVRGGLAIDNGTTAGTEAKGGGILNNGGTVTLIGAAIDSNTARGVDGASGASGADGGSGSNAKGGGIFSFGGFLTLKGSRVIHNQAVGGAGGAGAADTNAGTNVGTAGNGGEGGLAEGGGIFAQLDGNVATTDAVRLLLNGSAKTRVDDNQAVGGAGGAGGAGNNGTASGETTNGGAGGLTRGGGLRIIGGVTTITSALIRFNDAISGPGGVGGNAGALGVGGAGGSGGSSEGGGFFLQGDATEPGSPAVTGSTVLLNRAIAGAGGRGGDGATNTSVTGGAGGAGGFVLGGAVMTLNVNVSLTKSVISQNLGQGGGGGKGGQGGTSPTSPGGGGRGGAGGRAEGGAVRVSGAGSTMSLTTTTLDSNRGVGGGGGAGGGSGNPFSGGGGGGGDGGAARGGDVSVDDGALLNLTRSTISLSAASGGAGASGGSGGVPGPGGDGGAAEGGGLFIAANAHVTVTSSTVSTNTVTGGNGDQFDGLGGVDQGGGIWVDGGDDDTRLDLFNSTVAGNTALNSSGLTGQPGMGGGVFNTDTGGDPADNTVTAISTLIGDNSASQGADFVGDVNANFSLFESTSLTSINVVPVGGVSADENVKGKDPKLGPLQNNGGPTQTHALLSGSPAIDRGNNSILLATDQRGAGFARNKDGNGDGIAAVDIGAFEK
jgi:hypothetical protein